MVTDRTSGQKVVDVDLTRYLLMTRPLFEESNGVELSDRITLITKIGST